MFGYCKDCDYWMKRADNEWGDCSLVEIKELDPSCLMEVVIWVYDPVDSTFVESMGENLHAGLTTNAMFGCPNHRAVWPDPPIPGPESVR